MNGFPDLIGQLTIALRSRVASVDELGAHLGQSREMTVSQLEQLESWGFLSVTNDVITYRRPEVNVSDITAALLTGLSDQIQSTLLQTKDVMESLPGLLQAWDAGTADENSLHIDVLHGEWAPADMWRLQISRKVPRTTDVCMPDTSALFTVMQEYQASFWEGKAGQPIDVRLLMSLADATNPDGQERIRGELDSGVQIRMHPKPPSFFWIADHDTVGIPLEWGQAWPSSVMAIQSPVLAAILTWVYEQVWQEALPVMGESHRWDGMLRLMGQGLTMESAAIHLGLTPRTGRRRVTEAMAHYGVTSHFSLGAAWGKAQQR